ncbi:MAG: hypothetical protein WCJ13_00740 [Coriobacteriia bacterium]
MSRVAAVMVVATIGVAGLWAGAGCSGPAAMRPGVAAAGSGVSAAAPRVMQPKVRTVKLPYRAYGMARVVGDALYVSVDSGTGLIDTLLRYDLATGKSRSLFTVPADIAWITVNERWLLWESEKKLYAEPTDGGARQVLATTREAYAPALEGDLGAWVDYEKGSEPGIVTLNLKTGEKRQIARTHIAEYYNNFMQIRNGKLLWTDIYDGTGHYVVYDTATGKTQDYPMPATRFRYPGYALWSGEAIYSINFDRYDEWDWTTQQVTRYSLATGAVTPVSKSGEYTNTLVVGDNAIAVIDSEQRLLVGAADGTYPAWDLSATLGARVDSVQVSSDGATAVAGRSLPEKPETTLFIFQLR